MGIKWLFNIMKQHLQKARKHDRGIVKDCKGLMNKIINLELVNKIVKSFH